MTQFYTVHEPAAGPAANPPSASKRAERFVFVREGFTWAGFFLGFVWLTYHRCWLALAIYMPILLAVLGAEAWLALQSGGSPLSGLPLLTIKLLMGLEGNNVRRWNLERKGYRHAGSAGAKSLAEAEQRFYSAWFSEGAAPAQPAQSLSETERALAARIKQLATSAAGSEARPKGMDVAPSAGAMAPVPTSARS